MPRDLNLDLLILEAKTCQAERMMLIHYHTHPFVVMTLKDLRRVGHWRLALKDAGTPIYDYVNVDRTGKIMSLWKFGQPTQRPAEAGGVASNA